MKSIDFKAVEFDNQYNCARTLRPFYVGYDGTGLLNSKCPHVFKHENGWTIQGIVKEDYYLWVSEFYAEHPVYGRVYGDFENIVYYETEKGYEDFISNFPYSEWGY